MTKAVAPDGGLEELERRLDRAWFRGLAWCAARWRRRSSFRRNTDGKRAAPSRSDHEGEQLAVELAGLLARGALSSAESAVDRLLQSSGSLDQAAPWEKTVALEALLMLGQRERAVELATKHADSLLGTASGMSVVEVLGLPGSTDLLPNRRPNLLRLSRRLSAGELGLTRLLQLFGDDLWPWLRFPELNLLFFNALVSSRHRDLEAAKRFMNRFLRVHGSPLLESLSAETEGPLGRFHFQHCPPSGGGPLISVLMAAHNASATITHAVESLLGQSHSRLEVLVGDDASTDATPEMLRRIRKVDARLRVFRSETNQGPYNVRNALASRARGELLTFHDADDLALPNRLAHQARHLRSRGVVACAANWARVRPDGTFVFHRDQKAVRLSIVSLMLTRAAFNEVGPFRPARVGADLEIYSRLIDHYGAAAITRVRSPLILGLWSPSSATHSAGTEALEDGFRSAARRRYSELVALQRATRCRLPDPTVQGVLSESDNFIAPARLIELE